MGLEIKTFVHGASKGHMVWGIAPTEDNYANGFYTKTWTEKEMMLAEVREYKGTFYCYYSFIRGQKVLGADRRDGSYFAITLRMNTCYTDLLNMYHLLRAAYEKVCVGMCIEEHDSFAQITTDDFGEKENELKQMQKGLVDYIFQFSIDSDLAPLNGFQRSNGTDGLRVNASEARGALVLNALKRTGRVVVSHLFDTSKVAEVRKQADQAMQQCQADAARRIQQAQANAAASIEQAKKNCINEKKQLEQDLQQERLKVKTIRQEVQNECDKQIKDIRAQYASTDKKMSDLRRVIEQKDVEIKQKDKEIKQRDANLAEKGKQLDKKEKRIKELEVQQNGKGETAVAPNWFESFLNSKQAIISLIIVLALALFFIVSQAFILCHTWNSGDVTPMPAAEVTTELANSTEADSVTTDTGYGDNEDANAPKYSDEQIKDFMKAYTFSIDVKEFVGGKKSLQPNKRATISLKVKDGEGKDVPLNQFDWLRNIEFGTNCEEEPAHIIYAQQPGTYTLVYKVGDTEIVRREIEVR